MRILPAVLFTLFPAVFFSQTPCTVRAGNKEMVEKKITGLDTLNKKIVKQSVREIPEEGVIQTKAKMFYESGGIKLMLIERKVSPIKEKTIDLNSSYKNHMND